MNHLDKKEDLIREVWDDIRSAYRWLPSGMNWTGGWQERPSMMKKLHRGDETRTYFAWIELVDDRNSPLVATITSKDVWGWDVLSYTAPYIGKHELPIKEGESNRCKEISTQNIANSSDYGMTTKIRLSKTCASSGVLESIGIHQERMPADKRDLIQMWCCTCTAPSNRGGDTLSILEMLSFKIRRSSGTFPTTSNSTCEIPLEHFQPRPISLVRYLYAHPKVAVQKKQISKLQSQECRKNGAQA